MTPACFAVNFGSMKPIEFDTELRGDEFLDVPHDIAAQLPKSGHAKVIVYVNDENPGDTQWRQSAYEQFMREDSPEGSVYDDAL